MTELLVAKSWPLDRVAAVRFLLCRWRMPLALQADAGSPPALFFLKLRLGGVVHNCFDVFLARPQNLAHKRTRLLYFFCPNDFISIPL